MTDSIPAGFTLTGNTTTQGTYVGGLWTIGTLNVGDTATITLTGTIDAGEAGNTITNVTTAATGDQVDPSTVGDDLDESVVVEDNTTDLVTVKTLASGDATPAEGDTVVFDITVTNNGGAQATNVSLTDSIPAGFTLTGDAATQGTYVGGVWTIGTLNNGDTATLTLTGTIDAGQAGNTITNVVTAATGDQVDPSTVGDDLDESVVVDDVLNPSIGLAKNITEVVDHVDHWDVTFQLIFENNGDVALTDLSLLDDMQTEFGAALIDILQVQVANFSGTGTAPTINPAWATDTTQSIISGGTLDVGDSFEVTFVVGLDPDAAGESFELVNQATANGVGIDPGTGLVDPTLAVTDLSDNGTDPNGENGEDNGDGVFGNDPTPLNLPDIAVAKQVVGAPTQLANGNYLANFLVVVENTGTVDLANLSLQEDIATQFGAAYVNASGLQLVSAPTDASSTVTLAGATFNGGSSTEIVDTSQASLLAVGDAFTFEFAVEVDVAQTAGILENTITITSDAVDANGNQLTDALGNLLTAFDNSDSGGDASSTNPGDPGDQGTLDDPTPLMIADLGIAKSVVGEPIFLANGNALVTFEAVIANTGNVDLASMSLQEDIATQFGSAFQAASNLLLTAGPTGNSAIALASNFNGATVTELLDQSTNNYLAVGDSFTIRFDVEIIPDAVTDTLTNQIVGTGLAVDADGNVIHDASGAQILASDLSDGGADTRGTNPGDAGDNGTSDDPTIINLGQQIQGSTNGTSGSPANLRGVPIVGFAPISQLIGGFLGAPGPIYSGIPIASNANPLTLQSARPVTGGYATQFAVPTDMGIGDCGCGDVAGSEFVQSGDPYVEVPYMETPVDDCGTCEGAVEQPMFVDDAAVVTECPTCQDVAPCESCSDCGNCCGCGGASMQPSGVLFRLKNWLHR